MIRYRSRRPPDEALRTRLRELAAERRRFGYRRLHVLLRREGLVLNRKRSQRLYREEGLTVRGEAVSERPARLFPETGSVSSAAAKISRASQGDLQRV